MAVFATPDDRRAGHEGGLERPDGRGLRIGEDDAREGFVVGFARIAQDVRGDDVALVLAGCRQRPDAGDVADRPEPVAGPQLRVDGDPAAVGRDADGLEPDAVDTGTATGRNEQAITAQLAGVVDVQDVVIAVTPRLGHVHAEHQVDAIAAEDVAECLAQRCGLTGEHVLGAVDERHLAAEAANGLGHLDADRTTAQDQQAAGDGRHRGHLAVRPDALERREARNRRHDRFRAGGHDDVLGGVVHAVDLDRALSGEPTVAA